VTRSKPITRALGWVDHRAGLQNAASSYKEAILDPLWLWQQTMDEKLSALY